MWQLSGANMSISGRLLLSKNRKTTKIHGKTVWAVRQYSEGRKLVRGSILEGCRGRREAAAGVCKNLPHFRPRQTFSIGTGTQGQGDHRGQRSGYAGVFRQGGEAVGSRRDIPPAGGNLARRHAQSQAQAIGTVHDSRLVVWIGHLD